MKFHNYYERVENPIKVKTNPGSELHQLYTLDENGELLKSGVENVYEGIQSHKESVELATLLQRYARGDESALNQNPLVYGDTVDAPKTLADVQNSIMEASDVFSKFPSDFRQLFGDSFIAFWQDFGSSEFNAKVDEYSKKRKVSANGVTGVDSNNNSNSVSGNGGDLSGQKSE